MIYNKLQQEAINSDASKVLVVAAAGTGKALKNSTGVLTPSGYKPIGNIKIGDEVFDGKGHSTVVTGVYPQGKKQIYRITFSNGHTIDCCEDHLWQFQTKLQRDRKANQWTVKTTKEILNTVPLYRKSGQWSAKNIYLPMYDYVDFKEQDLPLSPYLLGALLGDGCLREAGSRHMFSNNDSDVLEKVGYELSKINNFLRKKEGSKVDYNITTGENGTRSNYRAIMRQLGLDGKKSDAKFIPEIYLFNSMENRLELLKGLMDTDGYCEGSSYEYITVSKQLAEDITFLCESLGYTVTRSTKECSYINDKGERIKCKDAYRLRIKTNKVNPIINYCKRKVDQYRKGQTTARLTMTNIEVLDEYTDMTCITVASEEHTFIIERGIVTHNTSTLIGAATKYAQENPNDRIVAITFTRKAALELQSRLFGTQIESSTIHSWSLRELNRLSAKHHFKVNILQDAQIQEILVTLARSCGYYSINFYMLFSYIMGNYNIDISSATKQKYEKVLRKYVEYKRNNRLYDFTDLPLYLYDILEYYGEEIDNIDALFVDEFQDVDPVQATIFSKIKCKKYFYIGDPQQSIYQFRDATPENLKNLKDFKEYKLTINYRSYQSIIDYANTACKARGYLSDTLSLEPCEIECDRKDEDGEVYVINNGECYDLVLNKKKDVITALTAFLMKKPYILCRTNKQVKMIQSFGYRNVSTIHQAKGLEYSYVLVTDMLMDTEEEKNIAYVACTRAQNGLMVCNYDELINDMTEILMEYRDEICDTKLF